MPKVSPCKVRMSRTKSMARSQHDPPDTSSGFHPMIPDCDFWGVGSPLRAKMLWTPHDLA
eukprot:scaffold50652_cov36-Attheya_sp.AAC.1